LVLAEYVPMIEVRSGHHFVSGRQPVRLTDQSLPNGYRIASDTGSDHPFVSE